MTETRTIEIALTDEEKMEAGRRLADFDILIDDNERDRERIVADKKAMLAEVDATLTKLYDERRPILESVRSGKKRTEVVATWYLNHDTMIKRLMTDDFQVLEEQKMDEKERQLSIEDEIRKASVKGDDDTKPSETVVEESADYRELKEGDEGVYLDFGHGMIMKMDEMRVEFLPDDQTRRGLLKPEIGFDREEFERKFVRDVKSEPEKQEAGGEGKAIQGDVLKPGDFGMYPGLGTGKIVEIGNGTVKFMPIDKTKMLNGQPLEIESVAFSRKFKKDPG